MINNTMGKFRDASMRTPKTSSKTFVNNDVYVSKSNFLQSCNVIGSGLYANRLYCAGDVIQEYKGKKISKKQSDEKMKNNQYMFEVKRNKTILFVIDAAVAKTSSALRYVNSVIDCNDKRRNTEFVQYDTKIYLVATKKIRKNDEFVSYYGENTDKIICSSVK